MDKQKALQIIQEAIHLGFKNGAYGITEAANIVKALEFIFNEENK